MSHIDLLTNMRQLLDKIYDTTKEMKMTISFVIRQKIRQIREKMERLK